MISKAHHGRGFGGAIRYITDPAKAERVEVRNLASAETAAKEMRAVADRSQAEKPVYHFSISWAPGEQPTQEQMIEAADRMSERLGMEKAQRVYAIHRDTDHRHIHIVANRVDPETGRAVRMSHDYAQREKVCREIEKAQGWQQVQGRHTEKQPEQERPAARLPDGEQQRERRDGREPFAELVKDKAGDDFKQASSWDDLATRLDGKGLRVEPWRQGLVVTDGQERAKASAIGRDCSRAALEKRFGERFDDYAKRIERQPTPAQAAPGKVQDGPFRQAFPRRQDDPRQRLYQDYRRETAQQIRDAGFRRQRAWDKEALTRNEERGRLREAQHQRRQAIYRVTNRGLLRKGMLRLDDWRRQREQRRQHEQQRKRWEGEKAKHSTRPKTWTEYVKENAPYDPRAAEELKRMQRRQQRQQPRQEAGKERGAPIPRQQQTGPQQPPQPRKPGILDRMASVFRRPEQDAGDVAQQPRQSTLDKLADERRRADRRDDHREQQQGEGVLSRLRDRNQAQQISPDEFKKLTPEQQRQVIEKRAERLDGRNNQEEQEQTRRPPQERERDGPER